MVSNWRPLVTEVLASHWPEFAAKHDGVRWVLAQIQVESAGKSNAVSSVGAVGLLQLMPATAKEMGLSLGAAKPGHLSHSDDRLDPRKNLQAGVGYLRKQYEKFPEIQLHFERLRWAFAAYNGGRGYCNAALKLAREDKHPLWYSYSLVGRWYLMHRGCEVGKKRPDYKQIWDYVARIERVFESGARG